MDATTPGPLAPDVLDRADVRAALAEHDFAAVFTLIKKWGGLSQNRIASACQLTPGKVSTIASGSQRVTSFDVVRRIADGLRIPGHMLGLAPRPWEHQQQTQLPPESPGARSAASEVPWRPDATIDLAADLTRSDLVMDRRAITRALAGAAVTGGALLESLEGWLQPHCRTGRTGPAWPTRTSRDRRTGDHRTRVPAMGPSVRRRAPPQGGPRAA